MNERLKQARMALFLTQTQFGESVGVAPAAISKIEKGVNNLTEQMILAVCRAHPINEVWLRTGDGAMFVESDNTLLAALSSEYGFSDVEEKIIASYLALPQEKRAVISEFVASLGAALEEERIELFYEGVVNEVFQADISQVDAESIVDGVKEVRASVFDWEDESAEVAEELAPPPAPRLAAGAAVPYAAGIDPAQELTEDEAVELVRERFRAKKEAPPSSTTFERQDLTKQA